MYVCVRMSCFLFQVQFCIQLTCQQVVLYGTPPLHIILKELHFHFHSTHCHFSNK